MSSYSTDEIAQLCDALCEPIIEAIFKKLSDIIARLEQVKKDNGCGLRALSKRLDGFANDLNFRVEKLEYEMDLLQQLEQRVLYLEPDMQNANSEIMILKANSESYKAQNGALQSDMEKLKTQMEEQAKRNNELNEKMDMLEKELEQCRQIAVTTQESVKDTFKARQEPEILEGVAVLKAKCGGDHEKLQAGDLILVYDRRSKSYKHKAKGESNLPYTLQSIVKDNAFVDVWNGKKTFTVPRSHVKKCNRSYSKDVLDPG